MKHNLLKPAALLALGAVAVAIAPISSASAATADPVASACMKQWNSGGANPGDFEASFMAACYGRMHGKIAHVRTSEKVTNYNHIRSSRQYRS